MRKFAFILVFSCSLNVLAAQQSQGPQCDKAAEHIGYAMAAANLEDRDLYNITVDDIEVADSEKDIYDYYVIVRSYDTATKNNYEISLQNDKGQCVALEAKVLSKDQ